MPNSLPRYKIVKLSEGAWGIALVLEEYAFPDPNQALEEIGKLEAKRKPLIASG